MIKNCGNPHIYTQVGTWHTKSNVKVTKDDLELDSIHLDTISSSESMIVEMNNVG